MKFSLCFSSDEKKRLSLVHSSPRVTHIKPIKCVNNEDSMIAISLNIK